MSLSADIASDAATQRAVAQKASGSQGRIGVELGVRIVFWIALLVLGIFVIWPTVSVLRYPGVADYVDVLTRPRLLTAARNSLFVTIVSTFAATFVGFVFAFAATRRDIPGRRFFRAIGMLPLFAPPFMVAFAYILMFGRQGLVTHNLFGLDVDIFGWKGLCLSQTIAFFPLAMMIIKSVLEGIHPSMEQAALTLGAREWDALRTVMMPLARPGVAGALLVIAITVLADFGNAVVIAGNYPLLATEAWFMMEGLADLRGAAVVVSALLVPTVALFVASRVLVGNRSYSTITGRGSDMDQIATPAPVKWAVFSICALTSAFVMVVYFGIVLCGLTGSWGNDWSLTLRHWAETRQWAGALGNSVLIAALAGFVTALIGQITAFLHSRALPFRFALDFLSVLPGALPGVFVGVGFVLAFNGPPLELAGTIWIIVFALGFWHLPQAYETTSSSLKQIHRSIEDAARNLGASEIRLLTDVYVPLLSRSLFASFVQSFVRSISNISIVVFLVAPGNVLVTFVILQMIGGANWSGAAALTTALLAITFLCIGVAQLVVGRITPVLRGA
ncbi:MAG: iron ABC transporter permease [Proteobacteria bacterium]|nr:iron ABC transporter permease [Pseudomonadota bacterium]